MGEYIKGKRKRVEKLYLYLTRKARKREEQSCSCQEELQRNWASHGGSGHGGSKDGSRGNTRLTEKRVKRRQRKGEGELAKLKIKEKPNMEER